MKFHPILFSTEMVSAILRGDKTMTRREVNFKWNEHSGFSRILQHSSDKLGTQAFFKVGNNYGELGVKCPYGNVGDILWVRESFCLVTPYGPENYHFGYKDGDFSPHEASDKYNIYSPDQWKPSIHMPKEACRIFLKIEKISIERLHFISVSDCIREGITPSHTRHPNDLFRNLWIKINGKDNWEHNPWVWVISFERIDRPNNFLSELP